MTLIANNKFYSKKFKSNFDLKPSLEVDVDIILGMPKNACKYHGICKIESSKTLSTGSFPSSLCTAEAKISFSKSHDLIIRFKKDTISEQTNKKHFHNHHFTVLESIEIPSFVSSFLGRGFVIQIGKYAIENKEKYYKVIFTK